MAKKVEKQIKLQVEAGKATPAPPVGTVLGPVGINLMGFCKAFNEKTAGNAGMIIPVVIDVYADKSFTFVLKKPPAAILIKKELNLEKGSAEPNKTKVATLTDAQVESIAKIKLPDLNAIDLEGAKKIIAGTARSMGVVVTGMEG